MSGEDATVEVSPELQSLCSDFFQRVDDECAALPPSVTAKTQVATIRRGRVTTAPESIKPEGFDDEVVSMKVDPRALEAIRCGPALVLPHRLHNVLRHARGANDEEVVMSPVICFAFLEALLQSGRVPKGTRRVRMESTNSEDETEEAIWFYAPPRGE